MFPCGNRHAPVLAIICSTLCISFEMQFLCVSSIFINQGGTIKWEHWDNKGNLDCGCHWYPLADPELLCRSLWEDAGRCPCTSIDGVSDCTRRDNNCMYRMYPTLRHISICLDAGGCFLKLLFQRYPHRWLASILEMAQHECWSNLTARGWGIKGEAVLGVQDFLDNGYLP